MNTEQPKIQLQTVGWVPADQVGNLNVGDKIMWNGGNTSEVTDVEQVSRCFRLISLKSSETGKQETPRRLKNTALVARIPQAKEEATAAGPAEEATPERLAVGTRVRHVSQQWATRTVAPKGTAVVVAVGREHHDGTCEYEVLAGEEFSRRVGEDNLMTRNTEWNSNAVVFVSAPPAPMTRAEAMIEALGPDVMAEARQIAAEVHAEVEEETAKEKAVWSTLPTLEGHTVRATLRRHMWTVTLYDGSTGDELFSDEIGDHVDDGPAYAAKALIRVREGDLKEAAALAALDDTTAYVALRSDAEAAEGVTAEEAREILRQARQESGPEPLRDYGAPRMTLRHSGAFWSATVHAYAANGNRLPFKNRRVTIVPNIVHAAGTVIMDRTGDGLVYPVAKPSIHAFGPWVRPVPGHADQVIVSRVANGLHQRPQSDLASIPWEEHTQAYQNALEGAGWTFVERTDDGDVYRAPR
jgi:hypothetical protein